VPLDESNMSSWETRITRRHHVLNARTASSPIASAFEKRVIHRTAGRPDPCITAQVSAPLIPLGAHCAQLRGN